MDKNLSNEKNIMDLHTHTVASVHAYSTLMENAIAAKEQGLEILGWSDHGYGMKNTTHKTFWKNLTCIPDYLEGVRILKGMEANLQNRQGDLMEADILDRVDYVIMSLHTHCYDRNPGDQADFTEGILRALDRYPQVNILGHPDDGAFPLDYEAVVRACKDHQVAIEVNNSSYVEGSYRLHPRENMHQILKYCRDMEVPVIMSSDAHVYTAVGKLDLSAGLLEEEHFPQELVINFSWERLEKLLGREI